MEDATESQKEQKHKHAQDYMTFHKQKLYIQVNYIMLLTEVQKKKNTNQLF